MKRVLVVFLILLALGCARQADIYVSPTGSDLSRGTKEKPFRTLRKAKKVAGKILQKGQTSDITVWLGEGTHFLDETLLMGTDISGQGNFKVSFKAMEGIAPVISGGVEIDGWEKNENGIWWAKVPKSLVKNGFRELFINGERAVRARHPDKDYLRMAAVGSDRRTSFSFNPDDIPENASPENVEIVVLHDWSISRIKALNIDFKERKIIAADSIGPRLKFFTLDNWEKNPRYFLENSMAFLNAPGEWYFDADKELVFLIPPEGTPPDKLAVTAPVTGPHLLRIEGTKEQRVKNIHFEGLSFRFCSWLLPGKGYAGIQACHFDTRPLSGDIWKVVPPAVELAWAENCSFTNCSFQNLGGCGLLLGTGCEQCKVSGTEFFDISGNGVMIGEGRDRKVNGDSWWKTAPEEVAKNNSLENSSVHECGQQFFGAVGIWCGLTASTTLHDNQVFNLPYSGISVGWMWNPVPTPCRENRITRNHIHHIMDILSDGGGIYMLGLQPGSLIDGNLIHDVKVNAGRAESNGMFLDEGITDVTVSRNIIYNIAKSPLRFHKATINSVRDNILSCGEGVPPLKYNRTKEEDIRQENNLVLRDSDPDDRRLLEGEISKWMGQ